MRGEVLHFDEEQGFGFIAGADGKRYSFARDDLRRMVPITRGTTVEFQLDGANAREIFVVRGEPAPRAAASQFGRDAVAAPAQDTDFWSYFWRGLIANYANFRDRASRKEFWSYALFWTIIVIVLMVGSVFADIAAGNLDTLSDFVPYITFTAVGLFLLATIIPWIAMTVRRLHDIGMSGWFALVIHPLMFVSLGYIVMIIVGIIPSQMHDNKWGPVPSGVAS
jgi:uncharacterized membrane protein YhaH (DUF805 family)/cold shock CspA family protein